MPEAADETQNEGLLAIGERVIFRHPLVRSAVYRSAAIEDRRAVHLALAEVTNRVTDPDRRAWHLAAAPTGPDEEIAAELERSAGRAQSRGGLAAAAAFLERATALSVERGLRAERALSAAQMKYEAGSFKDADALLMVAEMGGLDDLLQGRALVLRARISFATYRRTGERPLLLEAARHVEAIDPDLALTAYIELVHSALHAGRLDSAGLFQVCSAALGCPSGEGPPRPQQLLLEGLATRLTEGCAAGAPMLKQALAAFDAETNLSLEDVACLAFRVASDLWDDATYARLAERELERAKTAGGLTATPRLLDTRSVAELFSGALSLAAATIDDMLTAIEAAGVASFGDGPPLLAAMRGTRAGRST